MTNQGNKYYLNGSIGFLPLLTLLFIGLKLGKIIAWSWWWVLSPLWIPIALGIVLAFVFCISCLIFSR